MRFSCGQAKADLVVNQAGCFSLFSTGSPSYFRAVCDVIILWSSTCLASVRPRQTRIEVVALPVFADAILFAGCA
jgi:hypothetical protein